MLGLLTTTGRLNSARHTRWNAPPVPRPRASEPASHGELTYLAAPESQANAELRFAAASLREVRALVTREAVRARLSLHRREDLVLAIDELATNSVTHGGGEGTLRLWRGDGAILCEVRDGGYISDPLVGLRPPIPERREGRGLWVVSRLCNRVHIASSPGHTLVRVQITDA